MKFDYSQLKVPYVQTFIALDHNGTFYDPSFPGSFPTTQPPLLPYRDFDGKAFQLFLSSYTLNTFLTSVLTNQKDLIVTDLLLLYLRTSLKTQHLSHFFPQFLTQYGPDKPVSIRYTYLGNNVRDLLTMSNTSMTLELPA